MASSKTLENSLQDISIDSYLEKWMNKCCSRWSKIHFQRCITPMLLRSWDKNIDFPDFLEIEYVQLEGEGNNRGLDGWMASPTQWTCVWVNSGSWWWTGRPGVLRSMGLQRVGHDWETELNWYFMFLSCCCKLALLKLHFLIICYYL